MNLPLRFLPESERPSVRTAATFLKGRLSEQATINWALQLAPHRFVERQAIRHVLDPFGGEPIAEPWLSAWRLIEESWDGWLSPDEIQMRPHALARRIEKMDRSSSLIAAILELVKPVIKVEVARGRRSPALRAKEINDILSISLTSGPMLTPEQIRLDSIEQQPFLIELAHELDAAVTRGLTIADRQNWAHSKNLWRFGGMRRAYFLPKDERAVGENEPDEYGTGIAPSVKLLHAVVSRLRVLDIKSALGFVRRWHTTSRSIYTRLWAAFARDRELVSSTDVGDFLQTIDNHLFWSLPSYPEIAELRARRFVDLTASNQLAIARRIMKGPPRNHWPKTADRTQIPGWQIHLSAVELRRIEVAQAELPQQSARWLNDRRDQHPDLQQMSKVTDEFPAGSRVWSSEPNPDERYDQLQGESRLSDLEAALSLERRHWGDDPAVRAIDWMNLPGNAEKLLEDFENSANAGAYYSKVWAQFFSTHSPTNTQAASTPGAAESAHRTTAARVVDLISHLPEQAVASAIADIAQWYWAWKGQIVGVPGFSATWLRLWPMVVAATNRNPTREPALSLGEVLQSPTPEESKDPGTLNTPAGQLVGAFLAALPNVVDTPRPFDESSLREMRDQAVNAADRSGRIARYSMIEHLSWFLRADELWAKERLIAPLLDDSKDALELWHAVAHKTIFADVLGVIGDKVAERAIDERLGQKLRQSLTWSLVIERLHAFLAGRDPAVSSPRVQQVLRSVSESVRAHAAQAVWRFVADQSIPGSTEARSSEYLFSNASKPFLEHVWPQEYSLATPGVAQNFARLPASCGASFVQAVDSVERFLVPFKCWSLNDFRLRGEIDGEARLSMIDDPHKAEALLRVLDATIGSAEDAVVPIDLGEALEQIRDVDQKLTNTPTFRRLVTQTRR